MTQIGKTPKHQASCPASDTAQDTHPPDPPAETSKKRWISTRMLVLALCSVVMALAASIMFAIGWRLHIDALMRAAAITVIPSLIISLVLVWPKSSDYES